MSYVQLVQPNLSVVGQAYECLSYAESVFNAPHIEACATDAYNHTQFRYTGPPPEAIVPVWFSWFGTVGGVYKNWGHVAVYVPGKGFYSSPYNLPGHKVSASSAEIEQALGAKYLGWSEDISTLRVVKGDNIMKPTRDERGLLHWGWTGQAPGTLYLDATDGLSLQQIIDGYLDGKVSPARAKIDKFVAGGYALQPAVTKQSALDYVNNHLT